MRVVVCCPIVEISAYYRKALAAAGMDADEEPYLQEFGSQLYRDPDAIGLLWASGPTSAAMTLVKMREGQIMSRVMVLIERHGPSHIFSAGLASVLTAGADDVQPDDIDWRELASRLRAIARRGPYFEHQFFEMAGGKFFADRLVFNGPARTVRFTPSEGRVIVELARNQDRPLSKEDLVTRVYGYEDDAPLAKIIDVYVCKIRTKVAFATDGMDVIETIWGRGYQFKAEGYRPNFSKRLYRVRA